MSSKVRTGVNNTAVRVLCNCSSCTGAGHVGSYSGRVNVRS
jgi:hypothetical protein